MCVLVRSAWVAETWPIVVECRTIGSDEVQELRDRVQALEEQVKQLAQILRRGLKLVVDGCESLDVISTGYQSQK